MNDKRLLTNQLLSLPEHFKICSPNGEKLQMSCAKRLSTTEAGVS